MGSAYVELGCQSTFGRQAFAGLEPAAGKQILICFSTVSTCCDVEAELFESDFRFGVQTRKPPDQNVRMKNPGGSRSDKNSSAQYLFDKIRIFGRPILLNHGNFRIAVFDFGIGVLCCFCGFRTALSTDVEAATRARKAVALGDTRLKPCMNARCVMLTIALSLPNPTVIDRG